MAVNWKKGFRRVALLWAVLAAIAGGTVGLRIADNANAEALQNARHTLEILEASPPGDGSDRLENWNECTSFEQQKRLWKLWTGEDLEKSLKRNIAASEHRIDFRREDGWETFHGKELPYTPVEIDAMFGDKIEKDARFHLREIQCRYPIGTVLGAMVGFGAVWLVYLFFERLVSWIVRGFNGAITGQKSGEKRIEN